MALTFQNFPHRNSVNIGKIVLLVEVKMVKIIIKNNVVIKNSIIRDNVIIGDNST